MKDLDKTKEELVRELQELKQKYDSLQTSYEKIPVEVRSDEAMILKLLKAVNTTSEAIFLTDTEGIIIYVNSGFTALYGYTADEVGGKTTTQIIQSGLLDKEVYESFRKSLLSKREVKGEILNKRKNGELVLVEGIVSPILNEKNAIIGFIGIHRDITQQNKMEKIIRESEQRLSTIYNTVGAVIFQLAVEAEEKYRFISVNQAFCDVTGLKQEQVVGKIVNEVIPEPSLTIVLGKYKQAIDENRIIRWEEISEYPQGRLTGEVSIAPVIDDKGRCTNLVGSVLDVTDRKQSEEKLLFISKAVESTSDAIGISDSEGHHIYQNQACSELFEYATAEEIEAAGGGSIVVKDPKVAKEMFDNIMSGKSWAGELEMVTKSGRVFPAFERADAIKNNEGSVVGLIGVITDMTERKQTEERLMNSEERFRQISENSQEWIWEVDSNGLYTYASHVAENSLGYKPEEIIGKKHFYDFFLPEEREELKNAALKVFKQRQPFRGFINRNLSKDGRIVSLSTSGVPILDNNGNLLGYRGVDINITGLKRAEQIQKILYNISNAVSVTDNLEQLIDLVRKELGTIIDTTNFYIALYDHKTNTLSLPFFVDEKDKVTSIPAGKTLTYYVIKTKKPLLATKEILRKLEKSGDIEMFGTDAEIWLGVPLKIEGKVTGVLAIQSYTNENAYDNSDMEILEFIAEQVGVSIERKKVEQDLINALEKAEESDRLKSAFLCNMSHEIRTPMNGILGFAQLLKELELTGLEQKEYIKHIEIGSDRMLNIITNIVNISKIESRQMEVSISKTNVNEQIEKIHTTFIPEAEKKGLQLLVNNTVLPKETVINTDREKIYEILTSLVKNAIKFTQTGSIEFGFEKKGKYLEFFVQDTGEGIHQEKQEIIFERFRQGSESMSRTYDGAGLGLSISKSYVEMLGGKIWVESELGKGSTFYFTIPDNAGTEFKIDIKDVSSEIGVDTQIENLKILIVEDDESSESFLSTVLEKQCKEILIGRTGVEAIEICRKNPDIDLILMDIRMPEMNGDEATRQIRKFNKDVVIIAQTAYGLSGDREKAIAAGCNDYISKPIDKDLLMAMMQKHFN